MSPKNTRKAGNSLLIACFLFVCAMTQSCRDEYVYDDFGNTPPWLGESIYEELQSAENLNGESFSYFLRVIDDLNYKEVLSKTGSKTLFVANDEAFMKAVRDEWQLVGSDEEVYNQLTPAHKRIILYNAMLDNAYLLEMMSSTAATGNEADPNEGQCLRQVTSSNVTDSIPFFDGTMIPQFNRYWEHLAGKIQNEGGIRLATDATTTMMVHFLTSQLVGKGITDNDLKYLVNRPDASTADAYIFDKKVRKKDVTCKNGYIHLLDGLLIPPSNMAEEIRTNGKTNLFSHMLDRFAVPVYNEALTREYNRIYHLNDDANAERVYEKRYFTAGSNRSTYYDEKESAGFLTFRDEVYAPDSSFTADGSLKFSPGWNYFQSGNAVSPEVDMGVIFAPTDETLWTYFESGEGKPLIQRYANGAPLPGAIDSIPTKIIQSLVRNLMKPSFNGAVPSKFMSLKNDAQDDLGAREGDLDETTPCIIANNGVVYLTKTVYSPADYVAVSAPVMLRDNMAIANYAILTNEYKSYLLAMQSTFSLFIPSNEAMVYYDPCTSYTSTPNEGDINTEHYAYKMLWDPTKGANGTVTYYRGTYEPQTPENVTYGTTTASAIVNDALLELLEYNIIVGDVLDGNKYYMSKGYGTIKVDAIDTDGDGVNDSLVRVWGGRELEDQIKERMHGRDHYGIAIGETFNQKNGKTYRLDEGMIHPATRSVYNVLKDSPDGEFSEFFELCDVPAEVIDHLKPRDKNGKLKDGAEDSVARYYVFYNPYNTAQNNYGGLDQNVRSFNTYHYTVYVPTNEAIREAQQKGLPSWEPLKGLAQEITDNETAIISYNAEIEDLEDSKANAGDSAQMEQIQAQIDALKAAIAKLQEWNKGTIAHIKEQASIISSFTKYHVQDNSVYVDNKPHSIIEGNKEIFVVDYETSAIDDVTNLFSKVTVETVEHNGRNTISVRGDFRNKENVQQYDNICHVINTPENENKLYNIMTRDIEREGTAAAYQMKTSSFAVVHQIDGCLLNQRFYNPETDRFEITK